MITLFFIKNYPFGLCFGPLSGRYGVLGFVPGSTFGLLGAGLLDLLIT
jgi:hypothetical protein